MIPFNSKMHIHAKFKPDQGAQKTLVSIEGDQRFVNRNTLESKFKRKISCARELSDTLH